MFELTQQQLQAIAANGEKPLTAVAPGTNTSYVLLRAEDYARLLDYDDSPWTDEERDMLASEVDAMLADDMAIEDEA
jgi:hypothetical protein